MTACLSTRSPQPRPVKDEHDEHGPGIPAPPVPAAADLASATRADPVLARNHRLNVLNGSVAIVAINLSVSFYAIYAQRLGASTTQIALLTALPAVVMALAFLPAAAWLEKTFQKRRLIAVVLAITRVLVATLALVPIFPPVVASWLVVAIVALDALPGAVITVGWQSYMGEIFPSNLRAQLFAVRNWWMGWSGMIAVLVAGVAIDALPFPLGYQLTFIASALAGLVETYFFYALREPASTTQQRASPKRTRAAVGPETFAPSRLASRLRSVKGEWERLRQNPAYARFLVAVFLFHVGWMALWPVFTVYKLETLHANNTWMSISVVTSSLGSIFTYRWWSCRSSDRGNHWVIAVTALALTAVPAAWVAFARTLTVAALLDGLGGIVVGGFNLAVFNSVLDLADANRRATDIAYFNILVQMAGFLSPLAGMYLYNRWGFAAAMLTFATVRAAGTALLWKLGTYHGKEAAAFRRQHGLGCTAHSSNSDMVLPG
ncbi:MAG: MFS transporter [Limnochordaceae bacterium]|nr:MFS transporter [Limnochordaceae bacterium]